MEQPPTPVPPPPPAWQPAAPPSPWQPAPPPPAGSGWGPAAPPPPWPPNRAGSSLDVAGFVTVALCGIVALVILLTTDAPGDIVTRQVLWVPFSALAALVAPIAVLVSWGEFDLSSMGVVALGAYAYAEIANDDRTLIGAVATIAMCAGLGALVGTVRLLTHAHSVMVSISVGLLALGVVLEVAPQNGTRVDGRISSLLLFVIAMAIVATATGLTALAPSPTGTQVTMPSPRVIAGFALAGLGSGFYAVAVTSRIGFASPGQNIGGFVVLLAFAAAAIGGVGLGAGITAPLLAALGALVVTVVDISASMHSWTGWRYIVIGALFVGSVIVGGIIRRFTS